MSIRTLLWCAGVPWNAPRGTDQSLAAALEDLGGWDIHYVEPPKSLLKRPAASAWTRQTRPAARLTCHHVAGLPGNRFSSVREANQRHLRSVVHSLANDLAPLHAVVSTSLDDVLTAAPRPALRVLVGTDDYVAGADLMGLDPMSVLQDEQRSLMTADVITAITPQLAARWADRSGKQVAILQNGVDASHYASVPTARRPHARPSAILMGNLSERIDILILETLVSAGIELHLVGPHRQSFEPQRFAQLVRHPLVTWYGRREYDELPMIAARADVGITPYRLSPFNAASFPLKTLEYLAAGLPVVSTPLPAVDQLGTELVRQALNPTDFASAVLEAAQESFDPDSIRERQRFARSFSWSIRASTLDELLRGKR